MSLSHIESSHTRLRAPRPHAPRRLLPAQPRRLRPRGPGPHTARAGDVAPPVLCAVDAHVLLAPRLVPADAAARRPDGRLRRSHLHPLPRLRARLAASAASARTPWRRRVPRAARLHAVRPVAPAITPRTMRRAATSTVGAPATCPRSRWPSIDSQVVGRRVSGTGCSATRSSCSALGPIYAHDHPAPLDEGDRAGPHQAQRLRQPTSRSSLLIGVLCWLVGWQRVPARRGAPRPARRRRRALALLRPAPVRRPPGGAGRPTGASSTRRCSAART